MRIDIPVMIAASTLFLLFALDGTLGRVDGIILFGGLVLFVTWTLRATRRRPERPDPEVSNEAAPSEAADDRSSGSIAAWW